MNWILMLFYLAFMLYFYHLFGTFAIDKFHFKNNLYSKKIIIGYLCVTAVQWLIGFPCQYLHLSWNVYFVAMLIANFGIFLYLLRKYGKRVHRNELKSNLIHHIKNYWFIDALVIIFAIWSMTSQLPYLLMNYDDHYYLGTITQQIGTSALSTVNFFNGTPDNIGLTRLINTFEINYGFWASLFHMSVPFFARAVMVVHNYFIIFLSFHAFVGTLVKKMEKENIQYCLLFLIVLLIPAGFLEKKGIIVLYDGWQFNTAIWYGSSIVRCAAFPILLTLGIETIDNLDVKKFLFMAVPCIVFFSLSSIALPFILLSIVGGILYFIISQLCKSNDKKQFVFYLCLLLAVFVVLKIGPKFLEPFKPSLVTIYKNIGIEKLKSSMRYYTGTKYIVYLVTVLFVIMYKKLHRNQYYPIILTICSMIVIWYCGYFIKFEIISCMAMDFVIYRIITGLSLLVFVLLGVLFIHMILKLNKQHVITCITVLSIIFINFFQLFMIPLYTTPEYTHLTSGVCQYGYSFDRLVLNSHMIPQIYIDLGNYFDNLPNRKFRVISPRGIVYEDGATFIGSGLAMSSRKIENCISNNGTHCDDISDKVIQQFIDLAEGTVAYEKVEPLLKKHKIDYLITGSGVVAAELEKKGMKRVMTSYSLADDEVYLLATQVN